MTLDRRSIESALISKGFQKSQGDHTFLIYYDQQGKKAPVRTKLSHGTSHKTLGDSLVAVMAKQCRLSAKDFKELVACPLSRAAYEKKLVELGLVDPRS